MFRRSLELSKNIHPFHCETSSINNFKTIWPREQNYLTVPWVLPAWLNFGGEKTGWIIYSTTTVQLQDLPNPNCFEQFAHFSLPFTISVVVFTKHGHIIHPHRLKHPHLHGDRLCWSGSQPAWGSRQGSFKDGMMIRIWSNPSILECPLFNLGDQDIISLVGECISTSLPSPDRLVPSAKNPSV